MGKSLRSELLLSHLTLLGLMVLVMLIAVVGFFRLGRSVDRILRDNYKSVVAAQDMKESLERIDSATTFFLAGETVKARKQYETNHVAFEKAYGVEASNVTESGEQEVADEIKVRYGLYTRDIHTLLYSQPALSDAAANKLYFHTLEPNFLQLKLSAQTVLDLNQAAIIRADEQAKSEARHATVASVATAGGALVLALLFVFRMVQTMTTPLVSLTRQAAEIGAGHLDQRIETRRQDEIGTLARTFNTMAERLRDARRIEETRLHRAERMSDAALANLYDPVIVTDASARIAHLNRAAEGLFGAVARLRGRPVEQVVGEKRLSDAIQKAVLAEQTSAETGAAALVSLPQNSPSARIYRLRASPMTDEDGTHLGAVAVLEDVSAEQEIDRLKTEFIGVASHELRTPVTSLLLGIQLLEEGAVGALSPEQREVVGALTEDLNRLDTMMRDLLDLTRLEAGTTPPRFAVVSPAELVSAAYQGIQRQAEAKGIKLVEQIAPDLPTMRADRAQIGRVLWNLLGNALRHTPSGGLVRITAESDTATTVRFTVSDTGTGIPSAYLAHIFERFVQVPGATRGGAGLGLSLAQTMVRAHGGEITAKSIPGQGSVFSFTLPVAGQVENGEHT